MRTTVWRACSEGMIPPYLPAAEPELSTMLATFVTLAIMASLVMVKMMATMQGMHVVFPVLGRGEIRVGTKENIARWVQRLQEMAAAHPMVWRKVLLARGLIDAVWYNAVRDAMRGTGRELARCPERDEENWEYEGEVISDLHVGRIPGGGIDSPSRSTE